MPQVHADKAEWGRGANAAAPDEAGLAFRGLAPRSGPDSWGESRRDAGPVRLFHESNDTNARLAKLTEGLVPFPEVGQEFLGFRLIGELGRGAFGRVYLARQGDLADRPVALKVSTGCFAESQKLARLQHTHIVPVYSFHRAGPLQAVCMPYFGPTTLADVLETLGRHDTLPASGKGLVSTLHSNRTRSGVIAAVRPPSAPVAPSAHIKGRPQPAADGPGTLTTLRMLEGLSYVEAVLWIGARLAEGLAHAHERGVLHRDLKPANVLLTDEGQPMLLDFNLAEDALTSPPPSDGESGEGRVGGRVGGTLPYMAPEHLAAYQGQSADVDARSDIYALGVILYELLTGRHPFGKHPPGDGALDRMIRDRTRLPPPARKLNRGVTPAVDSILRRCLAPNPARRYQTAAELQEDLDRQRQHRPLRHAPDPSVRERVVKWFRRNPRAVTATRVGLAAGVLLTLLTAGLLWRGEQVARYESADRLKGFRDDLASARLLLGARAADVDERIAGRQAAQRALDRYHVDADGRWRDQPSFRRLSEEEKVRVQAELGEALMLLASADAGEPDRVSARSKVEDAEQLNRLAETCYPDGTAPRALWAQRAELEARLGRDEEARRLRERAAAAPVRGDGDLYLLAREQANKGRLGDAAEGLRAVAAREPDNFAVQFLMGNCLLDGYLDGPGQEADAVGCFSACIAMRPDFYAGYANRGLMRLRRGLFEEAEADFTRAVQLRPTGPTTWWAGAGPRGAAPLPGGVGRPQSGGGARLEGHSAVLRADGGPHADGPPSLLPARPGPGAAADAGRRHGLHRPRRGPGGGRRPGRRPGRLHGGGKGESEFRARLAGPGADPGGVAPPQPRGAGPAGPARGAVPDARQVSGGAGGDPGAAGDARRSPDGHQAGAAARLRQRRGAVPGRLDVRPAGARGGGSGGGVPAAVPRAAKRLRLDGSGARRRRPGVAAQGPALRRPGADGQAAAAERGTMNDER